MSDTQSSDRAPSLDRSGVKRIVQVLATGILLGVVLFASAGRLDWPMAWVYVGLYFVGVLANGIVLGRRSPELINERGRGLRGTKSWDKVWVAISAPLPLIMLAVAGLDAGRFGWSLMPLPLAVAGLVTLVLAYAIFAWAMAANAYFSTTVRIQEDRGHRVVSSGPYRFVRHPGYVGMVLMYLGAPVMLGSWWALIPGGLNGVAFIVRTALEDRTLQRELPGYSDYAGRVRYRLLPGIW
ncbi:MAG TPA: isoprenylcysteine carboxylmethyltransferase family protein [Anaerolineae bacterium]|nr:isoprenylcysteine carboxylmethyltransferase family protein [Anaerolineae bacterium]